MTQLDTKPTSEDIDPILGAVISNRLNSINQEMNESLMRSARSALIAVARDMSGAILTADGQLVSVANSLPGHMLGTGLQVASLNRHHPNMREGDAFLHNDPYEGATHPADVVVMAPVFIEGVHRFTLTLLAHQADIGNSEPTTYMAHARDVYNEGSLTFTATQVQRDYKDIDDIIRICRKRIRVPDQWYGDYRAMVGGVRLAEKRIKEMCQRYGVERILAHLDWMADYGESMMVEAIRQLPGGTAESTATHDPSGEAMPDGYTAHAKIHVDPEAAMVHVDLSQNADCMANGLNLSENTAIMGAIQGVLNCLPGRVPLTAGSFRRVRVTLRDGAAVGRPTFPHSCSVATTNLLCRLTIAVHGAFAQLQDGQGMAQSGLGMSAGWGVIAGMDRRSADGAYVNQLFTAFAGGPATPRTDGWVNSGATGGHAMLLRDSVEVIESKYPIQVNALRVLPGSAGAGRRRGAPGEEFTFGPRFDTMTLGVAADGQLNPPQGVRGGGPGVAGATYLIGPGGSETMLPGLLQVEVLPGQRIRSIDNGGGGYGPPTDREPDRVLLDVLRGFETLERAHDIYGVVLTGSVEHEDLAVDDIATTARRAGMG